MIKKTLRMILISNVVLFTSMSMEGTSKDFDSAIDCFQYEGDLAKRGNVKNETRAFDLLLNGENEERDDVVSTSFLKEKGKSDDFYAPWMANDGDKGTSWVEGVKGDGIGQKLYRNIGGSHSATFKGYDVKFRIINGYAKTEKLFMNNNRLKKARLTVYEARFDVCGGCYSTRYSELVINSTQIIELKDTYNPQFYNIDITKIKSIKEINKDSSYSFLFIAELEILEVYKGSKFDDTAISEFNVEVTNKK